MHWRRFLLKSGGKTGLTVPKEARELEELSLTAWGPGSLVRAPGGVQEQCCLVGGSPQKLWCIEKLWALEWSILLLLKDFECSLNRPKVIIWPFSYLTEVEGHSLVGTQGVDRLKRHTEMIILPYVLLAQVVHKPWVNLWFWVLVRSGIEKVICQGENGFVLIRRITYRVSSNT